MPSLSCFTKKQFSIYLLALVICVFIPINAHAAYTVKSVPNVQIQDAHNFVSNPDGILSAETVYNINKLLVELRQKTGIEIAIVALDKLATDDPRGFATELLNKWGVGQKGKDNGLLILLVTAKEQRSVVFETGYGLEGDLPDVSCYRIQQDYMLPPMREGDYSTGMLHGVAATAVHLAKAAGVTLEYAPGYLPNQTDQSANQAFHAPERSPNLALPMHELDETEGLPGTYAMPARPAPVDSYDDDAVPPWLVLAYVVGFVVVLCAIFFIRKKLTTFTCPKCGHKTPNQPVRNVLKMPTYSRTGLAELISTCAGCGYSTRRTCVIPRRQRSSSGGGSSGGGFSSGGSGSSGGSFGGGSSGGGGSISRF